MSCAPKLDPGRALLPLEAEVVERVQEAPTIFTLKLRICDAKARAAYAFAPGQFNMLYLFGIGEVPISIVSDPDEADTLSHTIRDIGRVTHALAQLDRGSRLGIRGPFGCGWPLDRLDGHDVILATGGLGCAPVVSVINYLLQRRADIHRLVIMQGVKHSNDLIWRTHYERWAQLPDTQVLLAADEAGPGWHWLVGRVTHLLEQAEFDPDSALAMMCGPEIMMRFTAEGLLARGLFKSQIWLSMERNMQCAVGHCGHCQYGAAFICRDGPVFNYERIEPLLGVKGF